MLKVEMQQRGYSILCAPFSRVGKLEGVQMRVDNWQDDFQPSQLAPNIFHNEGGWFISEWWREGLQTLFTFS